MKNFFKRIYNWGLKWADTRYSWLAMFFCAFADASFFPMPTPLFFIALSLLNIKNTYKYAFFGTLGIFFGAIVGYMIGHFAWLDSKGGFTGLAMFFFQYIPGFSVEVYEKIKVLYEKWDFWILFFAGYTPIPYKFFSISSGVFNLNLLMMLTATLVGQGIRFFLFAFLVYKIGPAIKHLFETKAKLLGIIVLLIIVFLIIIFKCQS